MSNISKKIWTDVVYCVRWAREFVEKEEERAKFFLYMAGGKASVLPLLGEEEKAYRVEKLISLYGLNTTALDEFLEENKE